MGNTSTMSVRGVSFQLHFAHFSNVFMVDSPNILSGPYIHNHWLHQLSHELS
jgi:hypothetical protein